MTRGGDINMETEVVANKRGEVRMKVGQTSEVTSESDRI